MESNMIHEVKSLSNIQHNAAHARTDISVGVGSSFIYCFNRRSLCVDLYSWRREVSGVGNNNFDWDVDQYAEEMLVLNFRPTKTSFRQAYRLARMCARMPSARS